MMNMDNLQSIITAFLRTRKLCVISTVNDEGAPQSALVAFSELDNGKIVIGTFNNTRKFANMMHNLHVSIVASSDEACVQIEGLARITKDEEEHLCKETHLAKNPSSAKYVDDPHQRFFIITPTWMRFTDHSVSPHVVEELQF